MLMMSKYKKWRNQLWVGRIESSVFSVWTGKTNSCVVSVVKGLVRVIIISIIVRLTLKSPHVELPFPNNECTQRNLISPLTKQRARKNWTDRSVWIPWEVPRDPHLYRIGIKRDKNSPQPSSPWMALWNYSFFSTPADFGLINARRRTARKHSSRSNDFVFIFSLTLVRNRSHVLMKAVVNRFPPREIWKTIPGHTQVRNLKHLRKL